MDSEEDTIQFLLNQFNLTHRTGYDWMLRNFDDDTRKFYVKCLEVMHGLGFIEIENPPINIGGQSFISITSKGRAVIINGSYKKYLTDQKEKERIEKEIYDNTKENLLVAKSSKTWVIIGVFLAAVALVLSIMWHYL